MSRIDEIKNRVSAADKGGIDSSEWEALEVEAYRDITYLLEENDRLREERDSFQRIGIRAQERLDNVELVLKGINKMAEGTISQVINND